MGMDMGMGKKKAIAVPFGRVQQWLFCLRLLLLSTHVARVQITYADREP